jgi:hypothetical protein
MSSGVATVLVLYVVSGLLMVACAMVPGQGPLFRVVTLLVGLAIAGWGTWIIVFGAWQLVGNQLAVLPILAVLVLLKSLALAMRRPDPVPYPVASPLPQRTMPAAQPAVRVIRPQVGYPVAGPPVRSVPPAPRQAPGTATRQADRPRDPWAALYASTAARAAALGSPSVRRD